MLPAAIFHFFLQEENAVMKRVMARLKWHGLQTKTCFLVTNVFGFFFLLNFLLCTPTVEF
jgi:hypothetical protein